MVSVSHNTVAQDLLNFKLQDTINQKFLFPSGVPKTRFQLADVEHIVYVPVRWQLKLVSYRVDHACNLVRS